MSRPTLHQNKDVAAKPAHTPQWGIWFNDGERWVNQANMFSTFADAMGFLLRLYSKRSIISGWVIYP